MIQLNSIDKRIRITPLLSLNHSFAFQQVSDQIKYRMNERMIFEIRTNVDEHIDIIIDSIEEQVYEKTAQKKET